MNTRSESATVTPINLSVAANGDGAGRAAQAVEHDTWVMSEIVDGLLMIADSISAEAANDPYINP